ncbi:MAG: D-glycerate dehydrogenase [Rhodospirillales bacterium]|nr:D-glycerate dehydrogenase [Rhodospirillales bacterium]
MTVKPAILVTRKLPDAVEERLRRDYDPRLNPDDGLYSSDELIELCKGAAGIVPCHTEQLSAEVIERLPGSIKIIANFSVGVDHCDLNAARKKGITVTNTPEVLNEATAEIALLLILAASRRAGEGERLVRSREWRDWSPDFMVGVQSTGKNLGIIGMGRVGQVLARKARDGLGMNIHYHNRTRLPPEQEAGAIFYDSVEELLPNADVLSLHCPATPETTGLLNGERISLLPDGAVVVNTARGALIDDAALVAALSSGKLWAAGLDVYNNEPVDIHPGYRDLDNVFLLPHIGSATRETRVAMGFRALDNLDAYFAGREPGDRVA